MTTPNEMKIKDELVLQDPTQLAADEIEYNTIIRLPMSRIDRKPDNLNTDE